MCDLYGWVWLWSTEADVSYYLQWLSFVLLLKEELYWLSVSIAVKKHHDQGNSYKGQHLIGATLQVQRFSPLSSRWENGSIQAGMAQAELRVLRLHSKAASGRLTSRQLGWGSYAYTHSDTPIPTRSHLFQQGHTSRCCHSLVQGYINHHNVYHLIFMYVIQKYFWKIFILSIYCYIVHILQVSWHKVICRFLGQI